MVVNPLPGADRDQLLTILRAMHNAAINLRGGSQGTAQDRVCSYLEWTTTASEQLTRLLPPRDLDRLILTPAYDRLLAAVGTMPGTDVSTQRVLNGMLSLEVNQRCEALEAAVRALSEQIKRWSGPGSFAVADSSFYIEHEDKLEQADFRPLLSIWEDPVHLLVPIVVVDQLDALKRSGKNTTRWRAGYTLAVLDRLFAISTTAAVLSPEDFTAIGKGGLPRGQVTVEIVFDPPGHDRLPSADDEIVSRSQAIQALAGRHVTLLTYDTGQATRARAAGLKVTKLSPKAESVPEAPS